ncbi:MAG: hypothetical protein ABSG67_20360 [Thermoguttaceae bacterium]|jgi:hypothetical protein
MKTYILALMAVMALTLYESQMVAAQWVAQYGGVTQGMFGYRMIGRPNSGLATTGVFGTRPIGQTYYVPGPGNFTSNIQFSPYQGYVINNPTYGYQVVTPNPALGPWYDTNILAYPFASTFPYSPTTETNVGEAIGPTIPGNPANPVATPENTNLGAVPAGAAPGAVQQGANPGNMQQGASTGAMQPGANLGTVAVGVVNIAPQRAKFYSASVLSARRQSFSRSPELSDRLTMLARTRGMLVGKGINVYMSNDVALIQGAVRSPADSAALASVLGLEPDVEHIDNRLSVAAGGN